MYELSRLPGADFTVGFYIVARDHTARPLYDAKPLISVVRLEMTNERDELVISTSGPLSSWTWSGNLSEPQWSFVYRQGASVEVPVGRGVITYRRVGELADAGWGTYFKPRPNGHYKLKVVVVHPDTAASQFQVQVQAKGGGWK